MTHETVGSPPARDLRSRLPSLTGMRFIAAALVFLSHSSLLYPFASSGAQNTMQTLFYGKAGFTGVTFFFVLSGFVLTWAMRPGDNARKFWRRRFFKIWPNHILTFLAAGILLTVVTRAAFSGWNALLNVLLLQSWSPDLNVRTSFNVVAWSLSCEAFFYFCFPFIMKLINRIRPERLWLWAIISAAAVISVPSFTPLLPKGTEFPGQGYTDWDLWLVFHIPAVQLLSFLFGIFMAKIVIAGKRLPFKLGGAVALTIGAYLITPLFPPLYQFCAVMLVPLGLLIAAGASADISRLPTFLGSKPMVWLGNISFAFYLWHYMILTYGHQLLGAGENWNTLTAIGVMALLFGVAVTVAWATFTFVEQPIMKRFANARRKGNLAVVTAGPTDTHTDRAA